MMDRATWTTKLPVVLVQFVHGITKKNYTSCGCVHGITTDKTREEQQTHWLALLHHDQLHKDIYHHTTFRVHPDHRGPNIKKEPEPTDGTVCSVASLFQIVRWKNEGCIGPRRS